MGRFLSMDDLGRSKGLLTEKRGNVSHVFIQQTLLEYQLLTRFWGLREDGPQDAQKLVRSRDGRTVGDQC